MIQDVIIYVIGLSIAVSVGRKVYRFFVIKKKHVNKCAGCTGCNLKEMLHKP